MDSISSNNLHRNLESNLQTKQGTSWFGKQQKFRHLEQNRNVIQENTELVKQFYRKNMGMTKVMSVEELAKQDDHFVIPETTVVYNGQKQTEPLPNQEHILKIIARQPPNGHVNEIVAHCPEKAYLTTASLPKVGRAEQSIKKDSFWSQCKKSLGVCLFLFVVVIIVVEIIVVATQ